MGPVGYVIFRQVFMGVMEEEIFPLLIVPLVSANLV